MNRKKYRKWLLLIFGVYIVAFLYYLSHLPLTMPVDAGVTAERKVMPLGMPVGIYIKTKGVLVLDTGEVADMEGRRTSPSENILRRGDYILEADGKMIHSIDGLTEILENWKGGDILLNVLRGKDETALRMTPVRTSESEYKIGAWIRQDAQGIGTLTYVDPENHFGALGHGITDVDTSLRIDISGGRLYQTQIFSIVKGADGNPGEMIGSIDYRQGEILGAITSNNENGIFGSLAEEVCLYDEQQALPVGYKQDGFYAIPNCFSKKKEDAERFAKCMHPYIGNYDCVYTRNEKGRELLLEGRVKALANREERCISHKKVKGALE